MASRTIQVASLILSVAALIVASVAVFNRPDSPIVQPTGDDAREHQIQELTNQLAQLRASIEGLNRASGEASPRQPVLDSSQEQTAAITGLQKRLSDLESAVAALRRPVNEPRRMGEPVPAGELAAAQGVILNPGASDQDKIAAMKALRNRKIDGQPALSHDVVVALLDVVNHSQDPAARTDVYRNLHGVTDPALRDSMVRDLSSDPSTEVREKIAEDFGTFLPNPAVEAALRQAAENDPDASVRERASRTLSDKKRR